MNLHLTAFYNSKILLNIIKIDIINVLENNPGLILFNIQ